MTPWEKTSPAAGNALRKAKLLEEVSGGIATVETWAESTLDKRRMAAKLDAAGWGMFFLWVGIARIADLGWGVGLLGVGVITLAGQAARKRPHLPLEGFWLVVGVLFSLGGIGELFEVEAHLAPILMVVAGLALLLSALRK